MEKHKVIIRAALLLVAVWVVVMAVRGFAGSKKITAERVDAAVIAAAFDDWSAHQTPPDAAEAARREGALRDIAGMMNRLDFNERQRSRDHRVAEEFFFKLDARERALFIDLTVAETMNRFMEALDVMPPEQRQRFVEQGLREIREGRTGEELARVEELGEDLLERISGEGMKAYFDKASTETKLDLAPLMEAMNDVMQGLRGNEFGPR
jgi:hypothetical protein